MRIQTRKLIFFKVSRVAIAEDAVAIFVDSQRNYHILKLLVKQQHIWKTRVHSRTPGVPLSVGNIRSSWSLEVVIPELRGLILDCICFAVDAKVTSNDV